MHHRRVMTTHHVAIWMDHNEARVLRLAPEGSGFEVDHVKDPSHHSHPKKGSGHREPASAAFLAKIEAHVALADGVLVCGPASAKDELVRHLTAHRPQLAKKVVGIEPLDRMTDGQLADHARKFFAKSDRMRGVHVGEG
jgi:stalled ribosome rescue protein Dom34